MRPPATRICATCGERSDDGAGFCPHDGAPLEPLLGTTPGGPMPGPRPGPGGDWAASEGEPDPRLGVVLPGGIRLLRLAARGATGRLYRAFQAGVDRDVAVKVLRRPASGATDDLARFHREARVASRIVHPHVVTVLLTGELPEDAGAARGEPYAVLEWLEGPTLAAVLAAARAASGALDLVRSLRIALRIAEAVGEAHRAGVLHRDIKPENVVLVRRGSDADFVKVLDFGLASLLDGEGRSAAGPRPGIVGTPHYLAPEAARGTPVPASDVHAVAAVLHEMLTGRPPFDGASAAAVLAARAGREPEDLRTHARAAYVPAPIAALVARSLSRDVSRRPRDGDTLAREILQAAAAGGLAVEDLLGPRVLGTGRPLRLAAKQRTRPHDPRGTPRETTPRSRARRP